MRRLARGNWQRLSIGSMSCLVVVGCLLPDVELAREERPRQPADGGSVAPPGPGGPRTPAELEQAEDAGTRPPPAAQQGENAGGGVVPSGGSAPPAASTFADAGEPSCGDDQQNGGETGIDCGGSCPLACADGSGCEGFADCQSGVCGADGTCSAPTCTDGVRNQTETAEDCGGSCPPCSDTLTCSVDGDCINANCSSGFCISCGDEARNGTETAVDCGGPDPSCRRCNPTEACLVDTDCQNQLCSDGACI